MSEKNGKLHAYAVPAAIPLLSGSCSVGEWRASASELSEASVQLPGLFGSLAAWSGSATLTLVGLAGIVYLGTRMIRPRGWAVVGLGLALDWMLSLLIVAPFFQLAKENPLGFWPYLLGTTATFGAGMFVGLLCWFAPLRFAFGMVSLDLLVGGLLGAAHSQPFTWRLVSRVAAAYAAAGFGGVVGSNIYLAMVRDRSALRQCLGTTALQVLTAAVGGVVTYVVISYAGL